MSVARAVLRLAARLVPGARRAEALEEWEAELWELRRRAARVPARYPRPALATARYVAGAVRHALWELGEGLDGGIGAALSPDALRQDLRHAARAVTRARGFAVVTVLTLALGIGATTTIFCAVNGVLLRSPRGLADPERLVQIGRGRDASTFDTFSYPNYLLLRAESRALAGVAAYAGRPVAVGAGGASELVGAQVVTHDYFAVLGVRPPLGRAFVEADETPGDALPPAVIGDALWARRFGRAMDAVGRTVVANGRELRIVGVAPPGFTGSEVGGDATELWVPMSATGVVMGEMAANAPGAPDDRVGERARERVAERGINWLWLVGRLAPGATIAQARAEMATLTTRVRAEDRMFADQQINVSPGIGLRPDDRREAASILALMAAAAGLVLLIACANLGGLLLARGVKRRRELGIRGALGASRGRLLRQLLAESLLLALVGGAAALALSRWTARVLAASVPYELAVDLEPDARVLSFGLAIAVATSLLVGLLPAWSASRLDVADILADGGRGASRGRGRARGALVAAQLALAFVLIAGAGLLVRSVRNALHADPGFATGNVLVLPLSLERRGAAAATGGEAARAAFWSALLERVRALPGVESAALAQQFPIGEARASRIVRPAEAGDDDWYVPPVDYNVVSADYFRTLSIDLRRGRGIEAADDRPGAAPVVVVNETLARRFWPGADAVGRAVTYGARGGRVVARVVGVTRDTRTRSLREAPRPHLYLASGAGAAPTALALHVRTRGAPRAVAPAVLDVVRALDPTLPVFAASTTRELVERSIRDTRLMASLAGVFGVLALAIALVGLYGVTAHAVAERTREIGIRIALGAGAGRVLRLVLGEGLLVVATGATVGAAAAVLALRLARARLYGVSAADPATLAGTAAVLVLAALVASVGPARRALRADPVQALQRD